jgi:hypothetical protein
MTQYIVVCQEKYLLVRSGVYIVDKTVEKQKGGSGASTLF